MSVVLFDVFHLVTNDFINGPHSPLTIGAIGILGVEEVDVSSDGDGSSPKH